MRELCGQMDLTFFLADDVWVHEFLGKLKTREIAVRAMLDLTADQTDPDYVYTKLAYEVKEQGGVVIDDPELTAFSAHKAKLHELLVHNRVLVPETVIVPANRVRQLSHHQGHPQSGGDALRGQAGVGRFRSGRHRGRDLGDTT